VLPKIAFDVSPLSTLVGSSPAMRQVQKLVGRVAKSRFPVLILGETGTGKEVVARAIHSMEAQGSFVVVDCSSLVGPLMESELFGYSKGAFTGAHAPKLGLLDSANGGTAFFDEIGELPLEMQMKLLRVLQQKEFRAIGAVAQRSSDFRVIAATNRDLAAEVNAGRFRQDLYYRLNVMRIRLAPLRERREDVPALMNHFLARYGRGHQLAEDALRSLHQYEWPGNVRELEHSVQQMVAMNSGPWLTMADLPTAVVNWHHERSIAQSSAAEALTNLQSQLSGFNGPATIVPLAEVERKAILGALDYTKGDRTVAAAMLGIGRTTLYRKLKEYGLQPEPSHVG
jgi:DNA-binding NtrC family response regulator